jgi:hypothetical protein
VPAGVCPAVCEPCLRSLGSGRHRVAHLLVADATGSAPAAHRPVLRRLCRRALDQERSGRVALSIHRGKTGDLTLFQCLPADNAGLVTIWNDWRYADSVRLPLWRSVFERRAPDSIACIESLIAPARLGQDTSRRAAPRCLSS